MLSGVHHVRLGASSRETPWQQAIQTSALPLYYVHVLGVSTGSRVCHHHGRWLLLPHSLSHVLWVWLLVHDPRAE